MNKKVKELIRQATVTQYSDTMKRSETFDKEKFAELIIDMCADHILTSSDRYRKEYFAAKVLELKE